MKSLISEFSYGFALTNEIVGWQQLDTAPIFPSLIQEGQEGGGYDLHLDYPGMPLFLQFKRSDCMVGGTARECKLIQNLQRPYHRFEITDSSTSEQHRMLIDLEDPSNIVLYAAPRFHTVEQFNQAWQHQTVSSRSIFVSPNEIGNLPNGRHTVAFDDNRTWVCSDPKKIETLSASDIISKITKKLHKAEKPLREIIPELLEEVRAIEEIRKSGEYRDSADDPYSQDRIVAPALKTGETLSITGTTEPINVPVREPKPIEDKTLLQIRELSELSSVMFGTQMYILQKLK